MYKVRTQTCKSSQSAQFQLHTDELISVRIILIQLLMVGWGKKDLELYSSEKITNRNFRWKSNQTSIHAKKKKEKEAPQHKAKVLHGL